MDFEFLTAKISDVDQYFYVCGPLEMIDDVVGSLSKMGVAKNKIVTEDM